MFIARACPLHGRSTASLQASAIEFAISQKLHLKPDIFFFYELQPQVGHITLYSARKARCRQRKTTTKAQSKL